jgi:hypothetical protein
VLPVLAQTAIRAPLAFACVIATVIPASLNDAVGFIPRCRYVTFAASAYSAPIRAW